MPNFVVDAEVVGMPRRKLAKATLLAWGAVGGTLALLFALPVLAVAQVRLLPEPRDAHFAGETALPATIAVSVPGHDAEDEFAARELEEAMKETPAKPATDAQTTYKVHLLRRASAEAKALLAKHNLPFDAAMEDEGYVLVVEPQQA